MGFDALSPDDIRERLETKVFGYRAFAYQSLNSTNATAKQLARTGAQEGTLVVAEEQTAGRGRFGRYWYSPKGLGIWLSLILRPDIDIERAPTLSLLAGLSLVEAIRGYTGLPVLLRWPNDVICRGKKVCGVLTEVEPHFVILGLGVNVNQSSFPQELVQTATSLYLELGRYLDRLELLSNILLKLERNYLLFLEEGKLGRLLDSIREFSSLIGQRVIVKGLKEDLSGEVIDVDEEGRLVLRLTSGKIVRHFAGEAKEVGQFGRKGFTTQAE